MEGRIVKYTSLLTMGDDLADFHDMQSPFNDRA
jgi:hypothetical protein